MLIEYLPLQALHVLNKFNFKSIPIKIKHPSKQSEPECNITIQLRGLTAFQLPATVDAYLNV